MEARGAAAPTFPVKSRKGKTEFTGKLAIRETGAHSKDPPMSRQRRVFGTLRSSNFAAKVPDHKTSLRPKTIPLARKMEKESVEFPEKTLRNQRKDNIGVQQTPATSSPGDTAMAQVANLKLKLTRRPISLAPETSSRKTGHIDPKLEKSVCFPEKSQSNLKEDNNVIQQTPVASSPGRTVRHRVSDLNPKPEKSVCLPMNSREDDMSVLPTPVASYATDSPPFVAPSAAEKPSSDEKTGDLGLILKKKKKKSVCFQEQSPRLPRTDDTPVQRMPVSTPPGGAVKPRRSAGTPYQTAESCKSRRLDRLETASYWLTQIKLSESATKHFVSAAFFCLAFESKAKPVRNLRVELKRYLALHAHLSKHPEWKDVSRRYGLVKDGGGSDCLVTRDIGLIKLSGDIRNRQGYSGGDIVEESREQLAASPPTQRTRGGPDMLN